MDTDTQPMSCQDAVELLPWMINGALHLAERQQVHEHLSACGSCRRELDETVRAWEVLSEHVPSLALAEYSQGLEPSGLDSERIERHLALCPSCSAELELAMAGRVLDFESAARSRRSRLRQRGEDRGLKRRLLAVAASFVVTVVTAALIWSGLGRDSIVTNQAIESRASLEAQESRQALAIDAWQERPLWNETAIFKDGFESGGAISWPKEPARWQLANPR